MKHLHCYLTSIVPIKMMGSFMYGLELLLSIKVPQIKMLLLDISAFS